MTEFYNPEEEDISTPPAAQPSHPPAPSNEPPQPIPTTSSVPAPPTSSAQPKKKFATLGDLQASSSAQGGHDHSDDDDDDPDYDPNLFAGGEKSGLAVQNPDNIKRQIIERAKRNAQRPGGDDPRPERSHFSGAGQTLGGDDTPSEVIPDPNASRPDRPELVRRTLHFWADGFSVDDGPLYRFDDPSNAEILSQIKQGRAPMDILNVTQNQEVDVHLDQHSNEPYKPPKKKFKAFEGSGQRLGSPTPAETTSTPAASSTAAQPAPASATAAASGQQQPSVDVNDSQPSLSLQIRLGDGTRLVSRFNTTHTIGDVYEFVNAASSTSRNRDWVLMTTFPSKELKERAQVLGDLPDFKRGGVVVQKWL